MEQTTIDLLQQMRGFLLMLKNYSHYNVSMILDSGNYNSLYREVNAALADETGEALNRNKNRLAELNSALKSAHGYAHAVLSAEFNRVKAEQEKLESLFAETGD